MKKNISALLFTILLLITTACPSLAAEKTDELIFFEPLQVKATKVEIKLSKKNTNLFIIIDDNGPGISVKEYENVFKPFYKIDKGRAESKSSVGLGLSIASDIIRSHGGDIKLEKSKMKGLRVRIFLPI